MSIEENSLGEIKNQKKITLGTDELQALIAASVSAAMREAAGQSAEGFGKLADAIMESRKPYRDPRQEENDRQMRQSMHEQRERLQKSLEFDQARCQHLQGSHQLSHFPSPYGLTSIILHTLDTQELIGICTNCGKVWRQPVLPADSSQEAIARYEKDKAAYQTWVLGKKSGNGPSAAGRRFFADPLGAIKHGQQ